MSAEYGEKERGIASSQRELAYNPARMVFLVTSGAALGIGLGVVLHTLIGLDPLNLLYWPTLTGCISSGGIVGAIAGMGVEATIASLTSPRS